MKGERSKQLEQAQGQKERAIIKDNGRKPKKEKQTSTHLGTNTKKT